MGKIEHWIATLAIGALALSVSLPARATVRFGEHDVRTIFFISKSDDRNRVDYGVHLDARCQPRGRRSIYGYWHRFEPNQPRFGELSALDQRAYGVTRQSVRSRADNGSWVEMRIASVPDERILVLTQSRGDGCSARAQVTLRGTDAILERIHVQLDGPMNVEHVTIHGRDAETGAAIRDRRRPPAQALIPGLGR